MTAPQITPQTTQPTVSDLDTNPGAITVSPTSAAAPTIVSEPAEVALRAACRRIAPVWPLESFVAVNPYLGLASRRFGEVAELLASTAGARATLPAAFYLDAIASGRISDDDLLFALSAAELSPAANVAGLLELARRSSDDDRAAASRVPTVAQVATTRTGKDWTRLSIDRISAWAAAYFDGGQAMWSSADNGQSLFDSWRFEAAIDRTPEVMGLPGFRRVVRSLPEQAVDAAEFILHELGIPDEVRELYLHALLLQVGGWAAHAARLVWESELAGKDDDTLVEFLAVLLGWELATLRSLGGTGLDSAWLDATGQLEALGDQPEIRESLAVRLILQDAFDRSEQRNIIDGFANHTVAPATDRRPSAQTVFCIDVRSEVFRRHLESVSADIDTIGFAGFFGFAIEYIPLAHEVGETQCPVLLTPGFTVAETVSDPARHGEAVESRRMRHHTQRAWKSFKMGAVSCFSFVGPVGLAYLPKMFTDAYGLSRPGKRPEDEGLNAWAIDHKGPTLESLNGHQVGIPLEARIQSAEGVLRAMSLTSDFARIVLIAGHGATTVNNPYDTGLGCGACGGHTGEANARVAAAILNDPEVRAAIAPKGIEIPADTWFLAGQHNTTTDQIDIFDRSLVPADLADDLGVLEQQLAQAGSLARSERARRMGIAPGAKLDQSVIARSNDWAQVRPEWGLAGCRAFVVAPRNRSAGIDQAGRSFLHSYDWRADEGFGVLELVMTAPMVVASWISLQYYASTVENRLFGSGNKTLHNVVGRLGVLEGNAGDLRVGLPWQSVHDGEHYQHEPLRLNVIIEAPIDAMNDVLAKHDGVRDLVDNGWLHLLAMDDSGSVTHRYIGGLRWEPVAA